ncbi:PREDICTED: sugar transport protein 13 [Tarenaya hassleriana]|uniref:sugar transport protein 13 n=1 Tax=Tarenaya hassleriana TaxID=28532 RepID=UPI00053C1E87|nr:PREDICTED: sugar transport protein 13 [Tarenaya hassleriana]
MPAGGFAAAPATGVEFEAKITPVVIISCIMAATGGLMFGYDVGVSGGVTSMPDFLKKFFPVVYRRTQEGADINSNYCKYDNQGLQLFTSSLYLAGLTATFFASYTTRRLGRRLTMLIAGVFFIIGVVLNTAAQDLAMLIIGRILLGCGVGFANQAVPLFLSEIAPTRIRGGLNILFQLNVTIGILFASLVNYGTAKIKGGWGWRLSLGLAGIPAVLLTVGALFVTDTPNSLVERGRLDEGKAILRRIRGTDNVEAEFADLLQASRLAKEVKHPFRNLLRRRNRPQLVIAVALQIFQQFTGINAIMFYAPVLFNTLGFGNDAALYSAVVTGAVNVLSTVVSIYSVDKVGRRMLLLEAGVQMFLSQVVIAIILGIKVKDHSEDLHKSFAILVVVLICTFVSAFAWSWGPLGWLIPSETFPLETRSAGQSVTVCINLLFTFVIAQAFLSMLCHFKYGIFLFFSSWVLVMSVFVQFLLPETKNVPIEEMTERVWKKHWFWARFMDDYAINGEVNGKKSSNGNTKGSDHSSVVNIQLGLGLDL